MLVDPEAAKSRQISGSGLEYIQSLEWSPDSRYFTYAAWDQSDSNRLYTGDAEAVCFKEVERLASASSGRSLGATWSPSGQYLLYQSGEGSDIEYVVMRPDGSGRISLTPLVAPSGSAGSILDAQWTRASDTVYFKKSDSAGRSTTSINFVEIDSLGQTVVHANGVFGFADRVYFTQ